MDQNQQKTRVVELFELITSLGHDCALVGGLAVSARTQPRNTKDVDVAVAVSSDTEAESLGFQLAQSGYRLREALEDMNTGYVSTLRFNHPRDPQTAENPTIDVLISTSGIEKETVAEATVMVSQSGSKVRVAQIPHLIAMKVLSESEDRGKDRWDLDTLIGFASSRELQRANELVGLIEKRGYNRDKDLQGTLRSFIARHRSKDQGIDL